MTDAEAQEAVSALVVWAKEKWGEPLDPRNKDDSKIISQISAQYTGGAVIDRDGKANDHMVYYRPGSGGDWRVHLREMIEKGESSAS